MLDALECYGEIIRLNPVTETELYNKRMELYEKKPIVYNFKGEEFIVVKKEVSGSDRNNFF